MQGDLLNVVRDRYGRIPKAVLDALRSLGRHHNDCTDERSNSRDQRQH